jgi:hypothetical protein
VGGGCGVIHIYGSSIMLRLAAVGLVALMSLAGIARAADKEVMGTLVKVDLKASTLTVKTDDGEKTYEVNAETKFIGPKGGVSESGLKDDRLVKGVALKLVIAGNNRTAREVHIPERKKGKDK